MVRTSSVRIILNRPQWEAIRATLTRRVSRDNAVASRNAVVLHRQDRHHRFLLSQPGPVKLAFEKYRLTGNLLPFGYSQTTFESPNP